MNLISPINTQQQQQVLATTEDYLQRARVHFQSTWAPVEISFNLRGRAAGQYRLHKGQRTIRYNPWIFAKYFDDNLANTVPHEVAHYVTEQCFGVRNVRPHGPEWREVMALFGVRPEVRGRYDLAGIPQRKINTHSYTCGCRQHELGSVRHRRAQRGEMIYFCRLCGNALAYRNLATC
jgi:SprT protein